MIVRVARALLSVVVGLLTLCGWVAALFLIVCVGINGYLNFPDLSRLPGGLQKGIASWMADDVAITALLTGIWPAIRAGRWAWRRSARWARGRE